MTKNIFFLKKQDRWFAILPDYIEQGGTMDDCEMVAGADEWLNILSEGEEHVWLKISDEQPLSEKITLYESDEFGATYYAMNDDDFFKMWLCPVTKFIFEDYPSNIYYEKLTIWD